jgi:hypothetical protein
MSSFTDLLNPTFLIILGIMVLVISLLVVYFETKNREQTHKISSMFSLVSSLAEEVNNLKYVLSQTHLQSGGEYISQQENFGEIEQNNFQNRNVLISVSDDDESEVASDDESDDIDLESVNSSSSEESDESDGLKLQETIKNDIKILKIGLETEAEDNVDYDEADGDNLDDLDAESISSDSSLSYEVAENLLALHNNAEITTVEKDDDLINVSSSELKTISINLEENVNDNIEYKKFSLPKLKNIVTEKGLASDTSKLKKNELLKLLGVEY